MLVKTTITVHLLLCSAVDQMGRWFIAGGAAVGLGALCYYGLGMSNEIGAIEKAVIWPQYVKDRIHSTYMYLAGSIGLTALSAVAVSRTPALMNFMMRGSWITIGATFAAMIGAGMLVQSISYEQSPGPKHLAWLLHSGVMGAVVAPLTILGGLFSSELRGTRLASWEVSPPWPCVRPVRSFSTWGPPWVWASVSSLCPH